MKHGLTVVFALVLAVTLIAAIGYAQSWGGGHGGWMMNGYGGDWGYGSPGAGWGGCMGWGNWGPMGGHHGMWGRGYWGPWHNNGNYGPPNARTK